MIVIIMNEDFHSRIIRDLRRIGITEEFELELRDFSKTYYGRYSPTKNRITLYIYLDPLCKVLVDYKSLFLTAIHEAIHCIQWNDKSFVRKKGVMHDEEFFRLYNLYRKKAEDMILGGSS